jgi:hypothetical protein
MTKIISFIAGITLALSVAALPSTASAETPVNDKVFGLGVQLGDPTAATMKVLFTEKIGLQMYIGGGSWWWWEAMFMTGIDFIWHPVMIYDGWKTCALNLTIGAGGGVGVYTWHWYRDRYDPRWDGWDDEAHAAAVVRMVTGVSLWFKKFPLEAFVELNPAIIILGDNPYNDHIRFHLQWVGAGGRWYF